MCVRMGDEPGKQSFWERFFRFIYTFAPVRPSRLSLQYLPRTFRASATVRTVA